jgi:hypothetical protein
MSEITLQLPGGGNDTFVGQGSISVVYKLTTDYLVNPGGAVAAAMDQYVARGGQGIGDGLGQNPYLGPIPIHSFELRFDKWEGETGAEWGGLAADATRLEKLQALDHALNSRLISSNNLAIFEHGEYSDGGRYGPLPVVVKDANLAFDAAEGPSTFTSNITLYEAMDAAAAVDTFQRSVR